jgi:hypothetical protein
MDRPCCVSKGTIAGLLLSGGLNKQNQTDLRSHSPYPTLAHVDGSLRKQHTAALKCPLT